MYDVIVVGARCGGSPTAMLLARKGYRVLLVDKVAFPSDTFRGHAIKPPGVARLKAWGLLDRVIASNCSPFRSFAFDVGAFALSGAPPPVDGVAVGYGPRRIVLDKILVDAALEAGAELRERFSVEEVLMEGDRVTGIRGRAKGGRTVQENARIVIGADGHHSLIARSVQAPEYRTGPALTCWYYSYWSGVPIEGLELYPRDHRCVIAFPTNDNLVGIATAWPHREFGAYRSDVEAHFLRTLDLAPRLAERARNGRREERFQGTADVPNFFRKPYGPGWALVGDAGFHKDPMLAQGISDAFRDAELLSEAIDKGLSGRRPLDEALADYERQRNTAATPGYEYNLQVAAMEPPSPDMQQLLGAVRDNPAESARFLGTLADTVPAREFFAPDNVTRIMGPAMSQE